MKFKILRGKYYRTKDGGKTRERFNPGDYVEMTMDEAKAYGLKRLESAGGVALPDDADAGHVEASRNRQSSAEHGDTQRPQTPQPEPIKEPIDPDEAAAADAEKPASVQMVNAPKPAAAKPGDKI